MKYRTCRGAVPRLKDNFRKILMIAQRFLSNGAACGDALQTGQSLVVADDVDFCRRAYGVNRCDVRAAMSNLGGVA